MQQGLCSLPDAKDGNRIKRRILLRTPICDFVEDYQGDVTTSEENTTDDSNENVVLDSSNETPITSTTTGSGSGKKNITDLQL